MSILDWFAKKNDNVVVEREKLDIPGNLWVKCISCGGVLYSKELEENLKVCNHCGHHFRLTSKERLFITVDADSFEEINPGMEPVNSLGFTDTISYDDRIKQAKKKSGMKEAVITGTAKIEGYAVAVGIMDFSYMGGSMGSVVGEKITRLIETAIEKNLPVIIFSASGGARMQEGILSLMQMAKTSGALYRLKEKGLLYISVMTDPTTGGTTASFAMLGDLHITEPNALIGFAGPRVIEQTIRQKLPKGFQRSEYLLEHGMIDYISPRKELKKLLKSLLEFTQYNKLIVADKNESNEKAQDDE
ncbi:MAG: acetyl-CoA carboxylase, carboxyltransferase subunit beta [Candidatus Margulisbacteria bacterium]|nr:acetyl-CoA carboxylase, carboxyltransferase subunit beta [Candidatus Margulisiibacteriota bacterium]